MPRRQRAVVVLRPAGQAAAVLGCSPGTGRRGRVQIAEVLGLIAEPEAVVDLFDDLPALLARCVASRSVADDRKKEASWPTPRTNVLVVGAGFGESATDLRPGFTGRPSAICVRCGSGHARRARHRRGTHYRCGVVFDDGSEACVARVLVFVQVGLLGTQALLRRRQDWPTPTGLQVAAGLAGAAGVAVIVGAGRSLGPGLTASPLPNARAKLRTDGLYRHVRHPIYSAAILLSVARTVASGDARQAAVSIALGSLLYGKSSFEERALARRFPDYPAYAARTPRFVPRMIVASDNAAAPPGDSP